MITDDIKAALEGFSTESKKVILLTRALSEIESLQEQLNETTAALKEFISIVSESAEFEAAMLEPDGNFAEFLNKQQARVDSAVATARDLLAARAKP